MSTTATTFDWTSFFGQFSGPRARALLLDYDGTLAPFRVRRDAAVPHPEVRAILTEIISVGRTRVVIISGRALVDLRPLLGLEPPPEMWGCHGWERLTPDGRYFQPELPVAVGNTLANARQWATSQNLADRCETKPTSIAIHWRGLPADEIAALRGRVQAAWERLAKDGMEIHAFDGGLELRAAGRNKGFAVAQILREIEDEAIIAYAGDDRTDEDAFQALHDRGLSVLVRPEYRETAAEVWLRPPDELVRFLRAWLVADREGEAK